MWDTDLVCGFCAWRVREAIPESWEDIRLVDVLESRKTFILNVESDQLFL